MLNHIFASINNHFDTYKGRNEVSHPLTAGSYEPVRLPVELARRTHALLRTFEKTEGLVYWAGVQDGRGGTITTLVVPRTDASYRRIETSIEANAEVINTLTRHGIVLLGQAHSHPPGSPARHSEGDDVLTFSPFEGAVSIVVPDFATGGFSPQAWGVHRFWGGAYRFIPGKQRSQHLHIFPSEVDHRR